MNYISIKLLIRKKCPSPWALEVFLTFSPYWFFMPLLSPFSHVRLFATPWTVARQAPLSMGFSRQEYWSGLPFPSPGDLPDPGIKPVSLASPVLAGRFFTHWATWEASHKTVFLQITTGQDTDKSHLSDSYFKIDFFFIVHIYIEYLFANYITLSSPGKSKQPRS